MFEGDAGINVRGAVWLVHFKRTSALMQGVVQVAETRSLNSLSDNI